MINDFPLDVYKRQGLNDLEMIKYAGHGIAMKNAVKELKDVADEVIGHVDENGLEEYLKTID